MIYPPKFLSKKNNIEKVAILYKAISDTFFYYKQDIHKLIEKADQLDFSEQLFVDNFINTYDLYLSDLANSIGNLLLTKKDTIGDDGSLLIKPVNKKYDDYSQEIWYSYIENCKNGYEKIYPSRIICKYNNLSFSPIKEGQVLTGYEVLIGEICTILESSSEILYDIFNEKYDSHEKIHHIIDYLNQVIVKISLIQDYCLSNVKIVNDYLLNFKRFHDC